MCGIFGIINDSRNRAAQTVLKGLKKLEYRGYDSWGIALKPKQGSKLKIKKHIGKIGQAETSLPNGETAIGHTRWATHGGVTDQNAHPHFDCTKKIAVVHNGIVENYKKLRAELKSKGHKFISETDSEIISHLIEEKYVKPALSKKVDMVKAVFTSFDRLAGSNAVVVLDLESNQIIACRDGSPLVVGVGEDQFFLASDVTAFLEYTNRVIFLSDQEGVVLSEKKVDLYSLKSKKKKRAKIKTLNWSLEETKKGNFPHFMLKEIHEQIKTIPKTASLNNEQLGKLAGQIKKSKNVMLIACGTAYHCCLLSSYYLAEVGVNAQAFYAHEFDSFAKFAKKDTIVIAISQSGETADTLIASKLAKKNGAKLVAIINARGSTLERLADDVLAVGAGPEIAVVSTKAFTAQLATMYLLSQTIKGKLPQAQRKIKKLGGVLKKWLSKKLKNNILSLSKDLANYHHIYMIGKRENYPAILEFALKVKETSYIHAEAFASSELKHGVISLIQKNTPCVVLASDDKYKNEVLSSAMELKSRGATIIGISHFEADEFDTVILVPKLGSLTVFAYSIVGQLLGYYMSLVRGADPDKPRNLAKSVTVK